MFILTNKRLNTKIALISLAVLLLFTCNVYTIPCPQLCQQCNSNTCNSCFIDWVANADRGYVPICGCPQGYYMNTTTNICNFCPVKCISCTRYNLCTQCLPGYKLVQGDCRSNFMNSTVQIAYDLNDTALSQFRSYGFSYSNAAATYTERSYFSNCGSLMSHQPMFGKYAFDFDTLIFRTYYGLPFHQWAMIKFQFFIIDQWLGEQFIVQIEKGRNHVPTSFEFTLFSIQQHYDSSIRRKDFCGQPQYNDNLGIFNQSFMHTDSMLKFRIRTSLWEIPYNQLDINYRNINFGIRQVLLIVGLCPKNCLTCASRNLCGSCTQLYTLNQNFQCICDTNVAYLTLTGGCIKKCIPFVEIFQDNKCKPCGQIISGCSLCTNVSNGRIMCNTCLPGKFIYQGLCQNICPSFYYEQFTNSSCNPCPLGCIQCQKNQYLISFTNGTSPQIICSSCSAGYSWYEGACFLNCPTGTYLSQEQKLCLPCTQGCSNCTSRANCLSCNNTTTANYFYLNGICVIVCPNGNNYYPEVGCINVTCDIKCLSCFGSSENECYKCKSPYYNQQYSCVSQCSTGYHLQYPLSTTCLKCPQNCETCTASSCLSCSLGYWKLNNQCVRVCSSSYFSSTLNGTYQCRKCDQINCNLCIQLPQSQIILTNSSSICKQCKNGYYLDPITNFCVLNTPQCPTYFYYNQIDQTCILCPSYCEKCLMSLCLLCSPNKILNNGVCVDECPPQKIMDIQTIITLNGTNIFYKKCIWANPLCEQYINGTCIQCIYLDPSLILINSTANNSINYCSFSCPIGYSRISSLSLTCSLICPSNCLNCDTLGRCKKCNVSYSIYFNSCVSTCPQYYMSDSVQCIKCDLNCIKCQIDGKCIQCETGFNISANGNCISPICINSQINSSNICTVCGSSCATCTNISNACTSCINSAFYLFTNICMADCPIGTFPDRISRQCRPCQKTCLNCSSFQTCNQCATQFYLLQTNSTTSCLVECPPGTYISNIQQPIKCLACSFPCRSCYGSNSYQCLECISGYYLDYTTCMISCPINKYSDEYGHCDLCHFSCKQCYGPADFQCINCFSEDQDEFEGYGFKYRGKCYSNNCPTSTYYDQILKQCKQCQENCDSCSSRTSCNQCKGNTVLYNNTCIDTCPINTYYNFTNNNCKTCSSSFSNYCQQCTNSGCVVCATPYYRFNKTCTLSCPIGTYAADHYLKQCLPCPNNCYNCSSPNTCFSCKNNFKLYKRFCTNKCLDRYYYNPDNRTCQSCTISNCIKCRYLFYLRYLICLQCSSGYVLISGSSGVKQCAPITPNGCPAGYYKSPLTQECAQCHIACVTCTNSATNCTQCKTGYSLFNNFCIANPAPPSCIANCALCSSSSICTLCNSPYYLIPSLGTCVISCPISYYPAMRECAQCVNDCLTCLNNAYECINCSAGFYLLGTTCVIECPDSYFATNKIVANINIEICQLCILHGCQICANVTSCYMCQPGYSLLDTTGNCYIKPKCPLTYYYEYNIDSCLNCSQNCVQCLNPFVCITCSLGYVNFNGTCINYQCPLNTFQQTVQNIISISYIDAGKTITASKCIPCVPPCNQCLNLQTCINCLPGYSLFNSSCIIDCGLQFYSDNSSVCQPCSQLCLSCRGNSTTCTSCHTNFYLSNKVCVANCPVGMYNSIFDNLCRACGSFCLQCTSSTDCFICADGMWLLNGACTTICPVGYAGTLVQVVTNLYNKMTGICNQCGYPCSSCVTTTNQYQCLSCMNGFYLYQSRCLVICPTGFFANPSTSQCNPCPSWCQACTSYQSCQNCVNPQCAQSCANAIPSTCKTCQISCKYCHQSSSISISGIIYGFCLQCILPYHISSGRCVLTCPTGLYLNTISNQCFCPPPCIYCATNGSCLLCMNTTYLYLGTCYTSCPIGTTRSIVSIYNITQNICNFNPCIISTYTYTSSSSSNCSSCLNPYLLYSSQCVINCPNSTYQSVSSRSCQKCPSQCLVCQSYNNCSVCTTGYYLQPGSIYQTMICTSQCPAGSYISNNIMTGRKMCIACLATISGCQLCEDIDTCKVCGAGWNLYYNLTNNTAICVQICPAQYYSYQSICKPCLDLSCLSCSYSQLLGYQCTKCALNTYYIPSIAKCSSICQQGYYPASLTSIPTCQQCPLYCTQCVSATNCTFCTAGFVLSLNNQCLSICSDGSYKYYDINLGKYICVLCSLNLSGCNYCIQGTNLGMNPYCLTCQQGWYLLDGICYRTQCPVGYFISQTSCLQCNNFCLECSTAKNCTRCYAGYVLSIATNSTYTCTSTCTQVNKFFKTSTQTCQSCSTQCYQCFGPRFDQCISCISPFFLLNTTCTSNCLFGYTAINGICIQCDSTCQQCTGVLQIQCSSCATGNYLYTTNVNGITLKTCEKTCPSSTYGNPTKGECVSCSLSIPLCSQCFYNSTSKTPQCKFCSASSISVIVNNILQCKPSNFTCPPSQMYINSINQCLQCPASCNNCKLDPNTSQIYCYQCTAGYIWYNGQCTIQCPSGTTKTTKNSTYYSLTISNQQICIICQQPNCFECTAINNMTFCTICINPYVLYNGICLSNCSSSSLAINYNSNTLLWQCTNYTSPQTCQALGLYNYINLGQSTCIDICPIGYYGNITTATCYLCPSGCQICISYTSCLTCLPVFYKLNNNQCVSICPTGYLGLNEICYPCIRPCSTCRVGLTQCSSCIAGYVLLNSQCFQSCPLGYFLPINSTICSSCYPQCLSCTSLYSCTICLNSQFSLPNCTNSNTTQCLTNQYLLSNSTCANCFNTCSTCYGPKNYQCITCVGVLIYMNGQCIQACLSGFYAYTNQLTNQIQCTSCSLLIPNCLNCLYANSNSSCSQCQSPYLLSPDGTRCIWTCAQLNKNTVVYSISVDDPNRCGPCTSNCLVCQLQSCNQCAINFALYNGQCVNNCPVSTYEIVISGTGKQCASCGMNCLACIGFQSCKYCNGTAVIFFGICMSTCPSNYAPIPFTTTINSTNYTDDTCTLCSILIPRCINCSSTASGIQCSACQTIYKLVNGTCNQCQNQYYYDSSTSNCLSCNSVCLTCINSLQCTSCISGMLYVVSTGQCILTCPTGMASIYSNNINQCINCLATNCSQCSTGNISICTVCKTGYYLLTGSCYQTCPSGTIAYQQICQTCYTLNCQICPTLLSCNACLYGYYLTIDSQCVANCPFGTTSSISASNVSICEPCKTGCINCSNATITCNECMTGLIPTANGSCQYNTTRYCLIGRYLIQINPLICGICDISCNDCYGNSKSQCFTCNIPTYLMQNGQCISVCTESQFYNSVLNICQYCNNPCQTCINSSNSCTSCQNGYNLVNNICATSCPAGTYQLNGICTTCPNYCQTCINQHFCTACKATATILYNNFCNTVCPTGTYQTIESSSSFNSCNACPSPCSSCTNLTNCNSCSSNYFLYLNQCVQNCPTTFFNNFDTHVCDTCQANCKYCTSATSCTQCLAGFILLQRSCTNNCPAMMYQNIFNGINQCQNCSNLCLSCTGANSCTQCDNNSKLIQDYTIQSIYCIQQCPDGYNNITNSNRQQICVSPNCQNCEKCPSGNCILCQPGWYLQNNSCTQNCSISFFGFNQTWQCITCLDNCLICPNATYCSQCVMGYNFSVSLNNQCVTQAVFTYGTIANISGFTSNITQITSLVYLSTSAGPVFFGQMSSTYFNIQFCQFMFFHDGVAGNNSQMNTFLKSLNVMSMSSISGVSSNTPSTRRMLLQTQSLSFLQINVPIFAMMGCFIVLYLATSIIHKFIDQMCLSCSNFNFYVKQICLFLLNRFKWIYFDFVVWLSYLPFLYFSLKQVQKLNFNSGLQGFSSILSVIILIAYPLYPVLIAYNIKKNYTALCMQNDKMVQMSLSPWVYKVKRPQFIPAEGQPFVYCSKANIILLYYPLKYFRKFVFVLIVVICPNPVISLCILLGLNIIFIGYMGAFRPRTMPYMIFDFIIEGVMLAFQIFMVAYVIMDAAKISGMSIATHAFGFISANLSIIVAIVLNIVAYYKIFLCIYELYQHLKQKVQQKQKLQAKQKDPALQQDDSIKQNNINDFIRNTDFVLDDEKQLNKKHRHDDSLTEEQIKLQNLQKQQRDIANLLSDKDLIMNNIQPRYDGDVGENDQFRGLFQDKELYGDQQEINKDKFKVYEDDELPAIKNKKKKDKITKQNKKNKNKKNNMLQGQLDQTSQCMLKRKQEQYIENQKQHYNNNSGQRISEYLPNKLKSINQQRNINVLMREKSKTIGLFTGTKNNINNTGDQEDDMKLVQGKKNKNKINPIISQNQSRLSSAQSNQLLFTESPDKPSNTFKQFKNIQVKQGKYEEHSNKRYKNSKSVQEQFDDFMQGTINQNNKNKNGNQKNNYYKNQQQINEGLYKQRNKDSKLNKLKESLKQDQFLNGNLMTKDKNKEDFKPSKQKEMKSYDLKQLTLQNKNNKIANAQKQTPINQINIKERYVLQKNAFDQKNLREGCYVQKKKDHNLQNFFIEDSQKSEQLNYNEKNRNRNQKSDLPLEDGLLISRKPAQQRKREAQQRLKQLQQGAYHQVAKKEQRTQQLKLKKNIQKGIQEGQFTQPVRKREIQQYKLQNRQEIQHANNYNYIKKVKINQNKDANQLKDSQINEGIFSNRVKNSKQQNQKNNSQSQNNRKLIEQLAIKQRLRKGQIMNQDKKDEKNSFFSNIFGFNRNQNYSSAQIKDPNSSRPQRKNNEQQFQDNNFSSRIPKKSIAQTKQEILKVKKQRQQINEQYQEIKRKNKQILIKPKINYNKLKFDDNSQQIEDQDYSKRKSRNQKTDKKDGRLNMENKSDASDNQDFAQQARNKIAKKKQGIRSKARLQIQQNTSNNLNESQISKNNKQQQEIVFKRGGKGRLNINQVQKEQEEDLENIQL